MKRLSIYLMAGAAFLSTSCSDFLDTAPHDALSPSTTWKTETDAESFVVGCYNGLWDPTFSISIVVQILLTTTFRGKVGAPGVTVLCQAPTPAVHFIASRLSAVVTPCWRISTM